MFLSSDDTKWQSIDERVYPEFGTFPTIPSREQHILDFSVPKQTSGLAAPCDNPPDHGYPVPRHETVRSETPARKDASVNIPPIRKPPKTLICWDIEQFDEDVEKDNTGMSYDPKDYGTSELHRDAAMMDSKSADHIPAIPENGNFPKPSVAMYMPPPPPVAVMVPAKVLYGPNRPPPPTLQDAAIVSFMPQVLHESKPADVRMKRKQTAPIYIPPRRMSEVPPRMREVAPQRCEVPSRRREVPPRMKRASTKTSAPRPPVPSLPSRRGRIYEQPMGKAVNV